MLVWLFKVFNCHKVSLVGSLTAGLLLKVASNAGALIKATWPVVFPCLVPYCCAGY